jgi:hypothetical protein
LSADPILGTWDVTMTTPVGPQRMQLHILTVGARFTGRIESPMGNHDIAGSIGSDGELRWEMKAAKPMPITVGFRARIDGDRFSGTAKLGIFGKSTLSGERVVGAVTARSAARAELVGPVTEATIDPQYNEPYIDIDEQRSEPAPHRYVHGGFKGTDARFSFYFPPKAQYRNRFFHNTYPLAVHEDVGPFPIAFDVATGDLGFTFDSGAYYVQTNLGGSDRAGMADPAIAAYRVNAAAAKHSRVVAAQIYGEHRAFGYLFGGSGGSYQTIGSAENTRGVWDGFMPFVMATPNAIPSMFTIRMHALRVLRERNKLPQIMDAIDPGGSGDPHATLNARESAAFNEASRMGFPPRGWWAHETLGSGYFSEVAPLVPMLDPTYLHDFWNRPGYLGSDPAEGLERLRFTFETTVVHSIDAFHKKAELAEVPARDFADAHLVVLSGAAAGKSIPIAWIDGRIVSFALASDQTAVAALAAGDRVRIDNSWALALQTYHRHQVPDTDYCGWDQFRDADGKPCHPQREVMIGPIGASGTAGSVPEGRIDGKMLVIECLMDIDALAWQADWYRSKVRTALGPNFEEQFALWFVDHAQHDNPQTTAAQARIVGFSGVLQQGLRDLSAWVENGVRPRDTRYQLNDAQVQVPASAGDRGGIQPIVELRVNGGARADITAGQSASFDARIELPPDAGSLVALEWDFEGAGTFPVTAGIPTGQTQLSLDVTQRYTQPGTYFAVLRATSQREGDAQTPYGRIQNLGRVRVVVR